MDHVFNRVKDDGGQINKPPSSEMFTDGLSSKGTCSLLRTPARDVLMGELTQYSIRMKFPSGGTKDSTLLVANFFNLKPHTSVQRKYDPRKTAGTIYRTQG